MIQITVTTSYTEIYVGGGNFLTEAAPTYFHTFATRRVLLAGQAATDFREVTPAERANIEAADARWTRPPQQFIDQWNSACHPFSYWNIGKYNEQTGYFELNGLTDITYEEALVIFNWQFEQRENWEYFRVFIRTNIPHWGSLRGDTHWYGPIIDIFRYQMDDFYVGDLYSVAYLPDPITIMPHMRLANCNGNYNGFSECKRLENVQIAMLCTNISFVKSTKLSLASLQYLVANAANTSAITVTVHPDVFAKLSDETNTEWHQVFTDAAAGNIQFATT